MTARSVVVVGGGFAGLWSALSAARTLGEAGAGKNEAVVTLLNPDPFHVIRVRCYEADPRQIRVPLDDLLPVAGFALEWKTAAQPTLGARLRKTAEGVQIASVMEGSSAHRAGLSAADTVIAIDGVRVDSPAMVEAAVERSRPGATLTFHVFRNDILHVFELRLLANTHREGSVHRQP